MDITTIQAEIDRLLAQRDAQLREVILTDGQLQAYATMLAQLKAAANDGKES